MYFVDMWYKKDIYNVIKLPRFDHIFF